MLLPPNAGATNAMVDALLKPLRLMCLLEFASLRRQHQLDNLFGYCRLETLGMALVQPDYVGDQTTVLAVLVDEHLGLAGARLESPHRVRVLLFAGVVDVAGFFVYDIRTANAGAAFQLLCPPRTIGEARCRQLVLART